MAHAAFRIDNLTTSPSYFFNYLHIIILSFIYDTTFLQYDRILLYYVNY